MGTENQLVVMDINTASRLIREGIREAIREEMSAYRSQPQDRYLSAKQAARHVKARNDAILKALQDGELKGKRAGRSWLIKLSDLEGWRDA